MYHVLYPSFPLAKSVTVRPLIQGQGQGQTYSAMPLPYRLRITNQPPTPATATATAPSSSSSSSSSSSWCYGAEGDCVEATPYPPSPCGPYPEDLPPRNKATTTTIATQPSPPQHHNITHSFTYSHTLPLSSPLHPPPLLPFHPSCRYDSSSLINHPPSPLLSSLF